MGDGLTKTKKCNSHKYCSVPQCQSKCSNNVSLHKFPSENRLRKEWIRLLRIGNVVTKHMQVCSLHFDTEDYFLPGYLTNRRTLKKTSIPSKKLPVLSHAPLMTTQDLTRKQKRADRAENRRRQVGLGALESMSCECLEPETIEYAETLQESVDSTVMDAAEALLELQDKVTKQESSASSKPLMVDKEMQFDENLFKTTKYHSVLQLIRNDQELTTMTGLPHFGLLNSLTKCVETIESSKRFSFSTKERIVLTMMRLKLDVSFRCLAVLFQCSATTCQNYFHDVVKKLARVMKPIIRWPGKEEILKNMPACFSPYRKTRVVLDCTEVPTEKTRCLRCRILTYSHYKGKHTVKFLIGVSPSGLITFVSRAYGGRASDKAIFNQSDLKDKLVPYHDAVMIDKGFRIEKDCEEIGIAIIRPPFLRKKKQLSKDDAELTVSIAAARVHVERSIQRLKIFGVLSNTIATTLVPYMDEIAVIIGGIVNLTSPILGFDKY